MRHVAFIALKYKRYGVPLEELFAEGSLGLVRAIDKFEEQHGTRLATYATYWIRSYVVACILRSRSIVGGGTGVFNTRTFFRLRRERARASLLLGNSEEADRSVARAVNVGDAQLQEMEHRLEAHDLSLDAPFNHEGATLLELLGQPALQVEACERQQLLRDLEQPLRAALNSLSDRERFIVQNRLMADPDDEWSLAEVGERFGVCRERVRQLEERAKDKLRTQLLRSERHAEKRRRERLVWGTLDSPHKSRQPVPVQEGAQRAKSGSPHPAGAA
jgi:RNA polymerase sigma-32 factor